MSIGYPRIPCNISLGPEVWPQAKHTEQNACKKGKVIYTLNSNVNPK